MRLGILLVLAALPQSMAKLSGVSIPESSTCSHINSEYTACEVQTMCNLCIATSSCEFNVDDLACVARSDSNGTATTYCSTDDSVCANCSATTENPVCTGEDDTCICQSLCTVVEPPEDSGCSSQDSFLMYVGLAIGFFCLFLLVFLVTRYKRHRAEAAWQNAMAAQHRRESELLRSRQPHLALSLVGWRDTVELDKPQLHKLGACCYVMDKSGEVQETRPVGAVIAVDDVEPSTSMETSSTFSDAASPVAGDEVMAFPQPLGSEDSNSEYSAMTDADEVNTANSTSDKAR